MLSFKNVIVWYTSYFTNWILTPFILFLLDIFPSKYLFTLKLLLNLGAIGGFYITYIHPRYIYVDTFDIYLSGATLSILDFLFHLLPSLYFNNWVHKNSIVFEDQLHNFQLFVVYGIIYLLCNNPLKLYRVNHESIFVILATTIVITKIN